MAYMDRILADYREKGITTPEEARLDHDSIRGKTGEKKKPGKILPAQDFSQRDYSDVPDEIVKNLARELEAFNQENGGKADA